MDELESPHPMPTCLLRVVRTNQTRSRIGCAPSMLLRRPAIGREPDPPRGSNLLDSHNVIAYSGNLEHMLRNTSSSECAS